MKGTVSRRPALGARVTGPAQLTERQIEDQIMTLFLGAGWYPAKTDAGMVQRGTNAQRGHLERGYPDLTVLRRLPGTVLCLAVLIEVKTATGRLREDQEEFHERLRTQHGIQAQVVRDADEARTYIAQANALVGLLSGRAELHLQVNI